MLVSDWSSAFTRGALHGLQAFIYFFALQPWLLEPLELLTFYLFDYLINIVVPGRLQVLPDKLGENRFLVGRGL